MAKLHNARRVVFCAVLECVIGLIQLNYVTGSVMNTTILRPPLTPTLHADDSMILSLSFE